MSSGSGVGPEAPVMVLGGTSASFVARRLHLNKRAMRLFVLCGICGAHSAFFNSCITGIFGLESMHRLGLEYFEAFTPGLVASLVGGTLLPLIFNHTYGGVFVFADSPDFISPWPTAFYGVFLGVCGALVAFYFFCMGKVYAKLSTALKLSRFTPFLPYVAWVVFSLCGMLLPPILFWGEPELNNIITRNAYPLPHYKGSTSSGFIDLGTEYSAVVVFFIAFVKLTILPFNIAMNMKGGIVFPLFFIGGTFGQFIHMVTGLDQALCVASVMAAAQGAITRTPLSSALIAVFDSRGTCPQLIIPVAIASYTSTLLNFKFGVFPTQKSRDDFHWNDEESIPIKAQVVTGSDSQGQGSYSALHNSDEESQAPVNQALTE